MCPKCNCMVGKQSSRGQCGFPVKVRGKRRGRNRAEYRNYTRVHARLGENRDNLVLGAANETGFLQPAFVVRHKLSARSTGTIESRFERFPRAIFHEIALNSIFFESVTLLAELGIVAVMKMGIIHTLLCRGSSHICKEFQRQL